jgi:formylglycine-generating enzyme required for sulfatase activity
MFTLALIKRIIGAIAATLLIAGCADSSAPPAKLAPVKTMTNSSAMKLAFVPRGTFRMGSFNDELAQPVHNVTLSSFWIGQYEVTNADTTFSRSVLAQESQQPIANQQLGFYGLMP